MVVIPAGDFTMGSPAEEKAWAVYSSWLLRPATRERNPAGYRDIVLGFRLARTLPRNGRRDLPRRGALQQHLHVQFRAAALVVRLVHQPADELDAAAVVRLQALG